MANAVPAVRSISLSPIGHREPVSPISHRDPVSPREPGANEPVTEPFALHFRERAPSTASSAPHHFEEAVVPIPDEMAPTREVATSIFGALLNPTAACDALENRCVYCIRVEAPVVALVTALALIVLGGTQQTNPYFSFGCLLFAQALACFWLAHRILRLKSELKDRKSVQENTEKQRHNLQLELQNAQGVKDNLHRTQLEKEQLEKDYKAVKAEVNRLESEINRLTEEFDKQMKNLKEENEQLANTTVTMKTTAGEQQTLMKLQQVVEKQTAANTKVTQANAEATQACLLKTQANVDLTQGEATTLKALLKTMQDEIIQKKQELEKKQKKAEEIESALIITQHELLELRKATAYDCRIAQTLQNKFVDVFQKVITEINQEDSQRSPQRKAVH